MAYVKNTKNMKDILNRQIKTMAKSQPLMNYMWYLELPKIPSTMTDIDQIDISSRIATTSLPFTQIETDKATIGNTFWYYAKSSDISNINIEIYEYEDGKTREYLETWMSYMMGSLNDRSADMGDINRSMNTFAAPVKYKRNLNMYWLDVNKGIVYIDTYIRYFISGIEEMSSEYESSGIVKYNVTLTGDDIRHYDPIRGTTDGAANTGSSLETIANKVDNIKDFIERVNDADFNIRSVADILG